MKLNDQVVSRELAQEMRLLGAPQLSLYRWRQAKTRSKSPDGVKTARLGAWYVERGAPDKNAPAAYTVGELGMMLPLGTKTWRHKDTMPDSSKELWCGEFPGSVEVDPPGGPYNFETEADVRARMWIYLRRKKLI